MSKQPLNDFASGEGEGQRSWVRKPEFPDEATPLDPELQKIIDERLYQWSGPYRRYRVFQGSRRGRDMWLTFELPEEPEDNG